MSRKTSIRGIRKKLNRRKRKRKKTQDRKNSTKGRRRNR